MHAECAGLRTRTPAGRLLPGSPLMTISGLVSHLRWVESAWIEKNLLGGAIDAPWTDDDPDREFRIAVEVPLTQLLAEYRSACARNNELVASLDLDTLSKGDLWRAEPVTLRWVLLHLTEETARHFRHLDILRELAIGELGINRGGENHGPFGQKALEFAFCLESYDRSHDRASDALGDVRGRQRW